MITELKSVDPSNKDAIKKKIETLYSKISAKYPDNPLPPVPWKDDEKMDTKPKQRKTLLDHYNEEQSEDLLEDWQDVYVCSLTGAIFDAFVIGDSPLEDIRQVLADFTELVLTKYVAQAIDCNLSQYLADNDLGFNPAEATFHSGSDDDDDRPYYGYMSRRERLSRKAGRAISSANQSVIDNHVATLHDTADNAIKAMKTAMMHMKRIPTAADDLATQMQGAEVPYAGDDPGKPDPDQQEGKSLLETSEVEAALRQLSALRVKR